MGLGFRVWNQKIHKPTKKGQTMKHNRAGVLKETSKNQTVKERLANRHAISTHAFSGLIL
jgi:hypothetical protein